MTRSQVILSFILFIIFSSAYAEEKAMPSDQCPSAFDVSMRKLHSKESVNLCEYLRSKGPVLIVNTASHCGYTKQFSGLEALYQKYKDRGLMILGFPSNSFNQEEASEEGTARVCFENFGVSFPMFEHVDVKGETGHGVFQYLADKSEAPSWNFNKYLLTGETVIHYPSSATPEGSELEQAILKAL